MAQIIKVKRSSVPSKTPTTTDISLGELAINTYDGKLFLKKNVSGVESIIEVGTVADGSITSAKIANGTIINEDISASAAIAVSKLAASTISGVTLGNNLNTLTLNTSGTGLSGSATYNGSGAATFTVTSNATSANTASAIVARDASGNFSAGTITAALSGNATTATTLATSRTLWGQNFNGSANVTGSLTSVGDITGTGAITLTATSASLNLTATGANNVIVNTNGNERLRIDSSGNVGIGTAAPAQKFHAVGNFLLSADTATTSAFITQKAYTINNGTLSWEGSAGQLFSITNNLTSGSIFSVNDISGIPSIDVNANGTISLASFGGNVGVGTTSPSTKLDVNGVTKSTSYSVSNVFDVLSATLTTTSTSQAALSSLTATSYASVEYTIQAVRGTSIHTTKILLIEDGTTASITEYGTVTNGSNLATYDADINAGNVRLLVTPSSATSTKFQVAIIAIKV